MCAHAQSGRVVVDSQSMMQVYLHVSESIYAGQMHTLTIFDLLFLIIEEDILEVQVVAIDRELQATTTSIAIALPVRNDAQTLRQPEEARHLRARGVLDQQRYAFGRVHRSPLRPSTPQPAWFVH